MNKIVSTVKIYNTGYKDYHQIEQNDTTLNANLIKFKVDFFWMSLNMQLVFDWKPE